MIRAKESASLCDGRKAPSRQQRPGSCQWILGEIKDILGWPQQLDIVAPDLIFRLRQLVLRKTQEQIIEAAHLGLRTRRQRLQNLRERGAQAGTSSVSKHEAY